MALSSSSRAAPSSSRSVPIASPSAPPPVSLSPPLLLPPQRPHRLPYRFEAALAFEALAKAHRRPLLPVQQPTSATLAEAPSAPICPCTNSVVCSAAGGATSSIGATAALGAPLEAAFVARQSTRVLPPRVLPPATDRPACPNVPLCSSSNSDASSQPASEGSHFSAPLALLPMTSSVPIANVPAAHRSTASGAVDVQMIRPRAVHPGPFQSSSSRTATTTFQFGSFEGGSASAGSEEEGASLDQSAGNHPANHAARRPRGGQGAPRAGRAFGITSVLLAGVGSTQGTVLGNRTKGETRVETKAALPLGPDANGMATRMAGLLPMGSSAISGISPNLSPPPPPLAPPASLCTWMLDRRSTKELMVGKSTLLKVRIRRCLARWPHLNHPDDIAAIMLHSSSHAPTPSCDPPLSL